MNPLEFLSSLVPKNYKEGLKKGERVTQRLHKTNKYDLFIGSPQFKKTLAAEGVTARKTPVQFLGAYTARLAADVTNDGTRGLWWRYNHPLAIADKVVEKAIGEEAAKELGPLKRGLLVSSVAIPGTAVAGAYDITNVGEQFRQAGFAQQYAEEGSEDRRKSDQPALELFERFFLGRTGRPLAYEEAKKDIPDLTPERYGNFLRNYYQDKGLLGVLKVTPENLEGHPEARLLGYPVNIPMVTTFAGGSAGAAIGARMAGTPRQRFVRGVIGGLTGSVAGITTGNITNEIIASANRPKLPTVVEYETSTDQIMQ